MGQQDNVLRLLIAEESLNDAEMLISVLRNAGHAVRATRAEDDEDIRNELEQKAFDLFLCSLDLEQLPLAQAVAVIQQSGKDIPLLAIADRDEPERRRQALASGAADLVSKHDLDHLQLAVRRELKHLRDRRRLRRLEVALRETERRCYALLDSSRDPIAYVHEGMHIYANAAYLEKFGVAALEEIEGLPLLDMVSGDCQPTLKEFLRDYQKGKATSHELELTMLGAGGEPACVLMSFSAASIDGEPCTQILLRERADNRELELQLDTLSKQDLLTGLYNRSHFMTELEQTLAEGLANDGAGSQALLYIQLDNLDSLRQACGITAIDAAISQYAGLIAREVGDEGSVARFADEVFTVLLPAKGVHDSIALGEMIRQRVEEHVADSGGRTVTTTCSIGICMLGESGGSAHQVVNTAHEAAERARAAGGNQVQLHAAEEPGEGAPDLRRQLEAALEDDDFFLVYQPVASLKGDGQERYEARIRLRTETGEVVRPAEFIPQAEDLGLAPAIDRWVTRKALTVLAERRAQGLETVLFVKLSGPTLAEHEAFTAFLSEQLGSHGVDGKQLVFQVNEPVAVTQLNHAKAVFRALKTLRCGFSLDHFGSSLNPFQLVKHLPADYLKLDQTLSLDLGSNEENQATVQQIVETAHAMNRKVVAGYLEDVASLAQLWQYEADFVQGNFLQEPEPEMHYDFTGTMI